MEPLKISDLVKPELFVDLSLAKPCEPTTPHATTLPQFMRGDDIRLEIKTPGAPAQDADSVRVELMRCANALEISPEDLERVRKKARDLWALLTPPLVAWCEGMVKVAAAFEEAATRARVLADFAKPKIGKPWIYRAGPREAKALVNARCAPNRRRRKYWERRAAYYARRGK